MLTASDYIGIGVLITTTASAIVSIIVAIRTKDISTKVNGAATVQIAKIEALTNHVSDLKQVIANQDQTAAVQAARTRERG